jgi:hypothetical protein
MQNDKLNFSRRHFLTLSTSATLLGLMPGLCYANIIRKMYGKVWINNAPATLDTLIEAGDTIKTGANSQVIFIMGDDVYKLGARSTLRLRYNPDESSIVKAMRLFSGTLMGVFGKSDDGKVIESPTATMGIRGTGLFIQIEPESTYFCTCYGDTEIITHDASRHLQKISTLNHVAYSVSHDAHQPRLFSDTMKHHTNEELHYLESLVGRKPPVNFK